MEPDIMNKSFIDDNGNPCDSDSPDSSIEEGNNIDKGQQMSYGGGGEEPPRYFINAADLSEDDSSFIPSPTPKTRTEKAIVKPPPVKPRSRVPVSKSYPDIIQTTFNEIMAKENSDLESLVADSLENLVLLEEKKEIPKAFKAFSKMEKGLLDSSAIMTESQMMGGILAEKPPEAWVIDLNSLSMESSQLELERGRRRGSGSNSNSLSFFVNIDEDKSKMEDSMSSSVGGPEKKMFSMFVDMRENDQTVTSVVTKKSYIPKKAMVPKPVQNIMETSTSSIKSLTKKSPSPIFQHKAAAEAARKAARLEWEKQREKYFDSLEPNSMMLMMSNMGFPSSATSTTDKDTLMGDSTISNRSSLHVANVLESSFSSSIISSMEASGEDLLCQGGPCFKLGKDLLRMFQEGINTDVVISANGKSIKAHKCILASRSQYFAAILSGHWVEKAGNTINLDGFSYSVVQFALYHIYSGTPDIPDTIDLLELATLTDLLGLEGLRENISQTFRVKFCHNFHRPCTGCITGVLECFPIASDYGMDELHRKMIKWICKHFVRIWSTKGFANLGDELQEKCLRYSINHLSVDNILDHTLGCDQLSTTMPTLRWTEPIFNIVNQLAEECVQFLGENLSDVLQSHKFLQFGKGQAWNISRIEGTFVESMKLLKPDVACLSHTALTRLIELGTETIDEVEWSTSFVEFLTMLRSEVEKYLMANASKAVLSKCWEELTPSFKKKICSTSFMGYDKLGNKIVKNSTPANNSASGNGVKIQQQKRKESSSSGRKENQTRVASVKPMQSQERDHHDSQQSKKIVRTLSNVGRSSTMNSTKSDADSSSSSKDNRTNYSSTTVVRKVQRTATTVTKLHERPTSSRRTSLNCTASPTRTPNKPLTPSVPSKPSPLTGYPEPKTGPSTSSKRNANSARNLARQSSKPVEEPPKKTFISNSAKAAAVSKPNLKGPSKKTPTSSASSINSGSCVPSLSPTPQQKPNQSRYLGTSQAFPPRSSFSERSKEVKSADPGSRRNTVGQQQQANRVSSAAAAPTSSKTITQRRPTSSTNARHSATTPSGGHSSMPPQVIDFQSFTDSFQPDSLMSRSTCETTRAENNGSEVKTRTLAEIGRSSTFSKDEPTILGKMDGYGQIEYEDDYEDDYDE